MDAPWKSAVWGQFGAAIDMLDNALRACPPALWGDRSRQPEYWYLIFHTLFWLDYYLSQPTDAFHPPAPFGLEELDPAGVLPPRVYTQHELSHYLRHLRQKCQAVIEGMTAARARECYAFGSVDMPCDELLLYNLRHVQHGAAQLNLILRQNGHDAPRWVKRATGAMR